MVLTDHSIRFYQIDDFEQLNEVGLGDRYFQIIGSTASIIAVGNTIGDIILINLSSKCSIQRID